MTPFSISSEMFVKGRGGSTLFQVVALTDFDTVFTDEPVIHVEDSRVDRRYGHFARCSKTEFKYFQSIIQVPQPITLRNVINAMLRDRHYRLRDVRSDDHNGLSCFDLKEGTTHHYYAHFDS